MSVIHTDYGALGCGKFERGDSVSGHRPETTCPDCRANLIREGGMRADMFYPTLAEKLAAARAAALVRCPWMDCPGYPADVPILEYIEVRAHAACAAALKVTPIVHRIEDDDTAVCGATVGPEEMEHPDWTDLRSDVTCQACLDRMDEADFDRAHP